LLSTDGLDPVEELSVVSLKSRRDWKILYWVDTYDTKDGK